jgi:hypothetical protein
MLLNEVFIFSEVRYMDPSIAVYSDMFSFIGNMVEAVIIIVLIAVAIIVIAAIYALYKLSKSIAAGIRKQSANTEPTDVANKTKPADAANNTKSAIVTLFKIFFLTLFILFILPFSEHFIDNPKYIDIINSIGLLIFLIAAVTLIGALLLTLSLFIKWLILIVQKKMATTETAEIKDTAPAEVSKGEN